MRCLFLFGFAGVAFVPFFAHAFIATSSSFRLIEPVLQVLGGYATSTSFQLNQSGAQTAIGTSSITSSFQAASGFLYYPFATQPVVTATAGDASAALSWTVSQGFLGWIVSGYNIGQGTAQGGPYAYTSVGNVLSSTRSGLSNGIRYYFVVRAEDAFGNAIATSTEVSAVPAAAETPSPTPSPGPSGGGGGGGGGGIELPSPETKLVLRGRAYPGASLTVFKDGAVAITPIADSAGGFSGEIKVAGGFYTVSLYAVDGKNRRSVTTSFTVNVPKNTTTAISDIVIAPTIEADKSEVKYGSNIVFFGAAFPNSDVTLRVNSEEPLSATTTADKTGLWLYSLDTSALERGEHTTKSQVRTPDALLSPFSESIAFRVGDRDVGFRALPKPFPEKVAEECRKNGDINKDGKVNIVDFSIMLFFWNQKNPKNSCADVNRDGAVNLFDFSIMLFWWTG